MNVRVRHSNVLQVIPLAEEVNPEKAPTFGILYQKTEHVKVPGTSGPPALQIKREIEKHIYDREKGDLIFRSQHVTTGGRYDFASNSVYRVESLSFGGFLAFDISTVSYCRKDLHPAVVFHQ